MFKVILVDDARCSLEELAYELGTRVEVAGDFINMFDAVKKVKEMKATGIVNDRSFVKDKLDTASVRLKCASNTEIVLVMANAHSALKSFETDVLTKEETSKQIIHKNLERISLWEKNRIVMVSTEKIACCFLEKGNRNVIVAAENKVYQSKYTLSAFLNKVGESKLVRCHRSFAINPNYLSEILPGENNTMAARVIGYNREIPVSRQYSPRLRSIVGLHTRADCKKHAVPSRL